MPKIFKIILLILLLFLVFVILNKFFYQSFKNAVFLISSPIEKVFWRGSNAFSQWLEGFFEFKKIKIENENLKKQILSLKREILKLKDIEQENEKLRKALNLNLIQEYNLILADVISLKSEEDSILINQGKRGGVKQNMSVITEEKILIGRTEKVFDNFSQVALISQKNFTFSVKITRNTKRKEKEKNEEEILGIAKGKGNFKIWIELIPKKTEIKKGDLITTSFLGGIFQENLLVGEVKTVKKNNLESFQQAEIEPYFKKLKLDKVFLIK